MTHDDKLSLYASRIITLIDGKIVSDKSKITINNLDSKKRPVSAVADNIECRNVKKITVKVNKKIQFNLLYDKKSSLHKKIKLEQLRREII